MNLSIIIVSWNTCDLLKGCLTSIYTYPPRGPFEVLVVDNASIDGSAQIVKEHFPYVRLIENHENVGFARANNQAIAQTDSRYVLLLNPDTRVLPSALEVLIRFMDKHPGAGAAGSRLLNSDGSLQTSCYPAPSLSRELWRLHHLDKIHPYGVYVMQGWDPETPHSVDMLQGASLLLRREALDEVGLLDEGFFIYTEEVDLCYRLKKAGWRLFWVPQSQVIHYEGQSTQLVSKEMFLQLYQSKMIYFRKHSGRLAAWMYKVILFSAGFTRLLVSPLALFERPQHRKRHLMLASNYFNLLRTLPGM